MRLPVATTARRATSANFEVWIRLGW